MQHYFFDIDSGLSVIDDKGMMLRDAGHAHYEALQRAAEFACDASNLKEPGAVAITVRSSSGSVVAIVRLVCSIEVPDQTLGALAP